MNKRLSAAIAGAASLTLLLGGASTFALWNSETTLPGEAITAGNLVVNSDGGPGRWTDQNNTTIDVGTFRAVPGDTLIYTKTLSITATGDNLTAVLSIDPVTIVASVSQAPADVALADYLIDSATLTAEGPGVTAIGDGNARSDGSVPATYLVVAGTAGVVQDVTVTVQVNFPNDATTGHVGEAASKVGSVSLQDMLVLLTQI